MNVRAPLVPPDVVTVTLAAPVVALAAMTNVAVICVALTTVTLFTVTPELLTLTVAPATKFVPVNVTGTLFPAVPLVGLMEVRVGAGGFTVNVTAPLVPADVVTVTFLVPAIAFEAIANVAKQSGLNSPQSHC